MDARKYASKYIKPDQVRDGAIQTRIVSVGEDERYGRLMLELEIGSQFALNDGNTDVLIKAWGHDTDQWIGLELALELGTYKDWRDETEKETVKVRAISPATAPAKNGGAPTSKSLLPPTRTAAPGGTRSAVDDEIPSKGAES